MWRWRNQTDPTGPEEELTVKDDDPAVPPARLRVVPEADVVAVHAGRLAVVLQLHLVSTETGVSGLHPGQLQQSQEQFEAAEGEWFVNQPRSLNGETLDCSRDLPLHRSDGAEASDFGGGADQADSRETLTHSLDLTDTERSVSKERLSLPERGVFVPISGPE